MGVHDRDFTVLFEHMSEPAVVVDEAAGRVLASNRAFAALVARLPESLAGADAGSLLVFDGARGEGERAKLLGESGEKSVRVERLPCGWGDRAATLYLVKRLKPTGETEQELVESDEMRALFQYLREATEQLEAVNRVVAAVNSSHTIDEVFRLASEQMHVLVPFDRASIALCEDGGERLRVFALSGEHAGPLTVGAVGSMNGSVTQHALREREMVVIPELHAEKRFNIYADLQREGFRSAVCCPLFSTQAAIGSLNLTSRTPDAYKRKHLLALERLAPPLAIAIEKILLLEQADRRNEELQGLYEISRTFSMLTDTSEISGRLARAIAKLVGGEMCLIATYDRRQNIVRAEAPGYNTPPEILKEFHFPLNRENESAPIYQTGEPFVSNDPVNDPRFNQIFIARYGIRSVLSVPMRIKRELIGFIYVANRAGGFRERDVRLLEIFAAQAAETIVNARLFVTIQAQAEREAVVNRLLLSLQRSGEPKEKIGAVIERIGEVLELDRCVAVLFAENEHADFYGEWCAEGIEPITNRVEVQERSPLRHLLKTDRRPLFAADVRTHPHASGFEDLIEVTKVQSLLVVPIMHQGRVIGSLSAHQTRRKRHWGEDDIDLLTAVATHVGSTLENARLIAELREANRLKDEFLATLSHELRTPLTAITGWVDILVENEALKTDEELADGISAISTSATSLAQLISDLLDLSRIQRSMLHLERETCDINAAVLSAVQTVRHSAAAHKLEILLDLDEKLPMTVVDGQRIQQVFWNLLTNAIKFTPEGGHVTVRSRLFDEGSDGEAAAGGRSRWIVIEVEDTGEGIAPDFLPFIWDRFRQADSSATRRYGGLGIGLSLVKELVEAHGGRVEAASEGRGATFTLRLPVIDVGEWINQ